ncbi:MAG: AraC family transcriptional regulator [Pirellulales bacterium]
MTHRIPTFRSKVTSYEADSCDALVAGVQEGKIRMQALARGHYPGRRLAPHALPGLKTAGFWDADQQQDWGLDWHRNEGLELMFLETGHVTFSTNRQTCQLEGDDLAITRPWQRHKVGDPYVGAGRLHWIILDVGVRRPHQKWRWPDWLVLTESDRNTMTEFFRQSEQSKWHAGIEIRKCYQKISKAIEEDQDGSNLSRLAVYLNELLLLILDMFQAKQLPLDKSLTTTRHTVELFLDELKQDTHLLTHAWSVQAMAEQCGLGVTRFVHQVRQLTNMTPAHYLVRCRLEVAADWLVHHPTKSVTTIAFACGFASSQYFATVFRHHYGCTPRDFRAESLESLTKS